MMFGKKYRYFVSYHWNKGINNGFGSTLASRDKKIKTMLDINDVRVAIEENDNFDKVTIINYYKMKV